MCVLIVCRIPGARFPVLVAANREEDPERAAHPPGLHLVDRVRTLCPQDRRHGGTWIGLNEHGVFAALTNYAESPSDPNARTRGAVPFVALGQPSLESAVQAVVAHCQRGPLRPFQMLIGDARELAWVRCAEGRIERSRCEDDMVVLTNRHEPGAVDVPGLASWLREQRDPHDPLDRANVDAQLDHLTVVLATGKGLVQDGTSFGLCIDEGLPRTVSSTLIALPDQGVDGARIRHCAGSPRVAPTRDYSGLVRRLQEPLG